MNYTFRAWVNGVMIYNVGVLPDNHIWFNDSEIPKDVPEDFFDGLIEGEAGYWKLDGFELMLCSPWVDKEGKPVYAGDIIETTYKDKMEETGIVTVRNEVRFHEGRFVWVGENSGQCIPMDEYDCSKSIVAGNIYQNKELLEAN